MNLAGSVGDGPIVGANISIVDGTGNPVVEVTGDLLAGYEVSVPDGAPLPLTVTATGGTDLVTGRPAEFPLKAVVFETGPATLNVIPYTTLAVAIAECRGDLTPGGLNDVWATLDQQLNMGWRSDVVGDPMVAALGADNAATILLANEALGEVLRRPEAALSSAGRAVTQQELL